MSLQYGELRPTNGWDLLVSLGHPSKFPRVSYFGSVTARHSSSGRQQNFAALNRRLDLYSEGWPSRSAFAHILVKNVSWPSGWNLAISITLAIGFYNNCCASNDWQWKASFDCAVHELWWYGLSVVDWNAVSGVHVCRLLTMLLEKWEKLHLMHLALQWRWSLRKLSCLSWLMLTAWSWQRLVCMLALLNEFSGFIC